MSRLHLVLCLMMVFGGGLLASCSNDSDGDGALCVTKEDCKPHQQCKDSACISVSEAKLNEPCHETLICVEPLVCRDAVCVEGAASCKTKDECPNDLVCRDGVCIKTDGACKTKDECPNDLVCRDGVCIKADASCKTKDECPNDLVCRDGVCIKADGACKTKDECLNDLVCRDGVCVDPPIEYAKEGESCMNQDCEPGTECSWDYVCQRILKRGEACEIGDICTDLDQCLDGFCKGAAYPGDLCDAEVVCYDSTCRNGACLKNAGLFEPCNDDDGPICSSSLICVDRQCVKLKGDCDAENPKCNGDSYCCLGASCGENIGKCVPYKAEGHDETCRYAMKPGIFEAAVQCHWREALEVPNNEITSSMSTPLVGRFGNKIGWDKPLIATLTFGNNRGVTAIRVIHPETCKLVETIAINSDSYNNLASADLNGNGLLEIVVYEEGLGPVIFTWDESEQKHIIMHKADSPGITSQGHGTYSIHDIDGDGVPEIISTFGDVYTHKAELIVKGKGGTAYSGPTIANLDGKGGAELITGNNVFTWNIEQKNWGLRYSLPNAAGNQSAYADFGTPGETAEDFDFETLDGWPEIVTVGANVNIWAVLDKEGEDLATVQLVMTQPRIGGRGYPVAVGDLNGDGFPDIAVSGKGPNDKPNKGLITALSPLCLAAVLGRCVSKNTMWERDIQDGSGVAGTSLFDFDGDNKAEIVYGDECYTRVFDGSTGEVIFSSSRNSGTVVEYPTIADVDDDGSAEIVVVSDKYNLSCSKIDPIHKGVMCTEDSDCYSGRCAGGLCRCIEKVNEADRDDCNWQTVNGKLFVQYICTEPIDGSATLGEVCRATHTEIRPGITVLRDRLDRWVTARPLWNQHAYNVTNINDDGTIPKLSDWLPNWLETTLNNFRQNSIGLDGRAGAAPDITGRFISSADVCKTNEEGQIVLSAQVCNRGTKAVGRQMPAVFYEGEASEAHILCASYTDGVVPVSGCKMVSCEIDIERAKLLAGKKILLLVNDDGKGGKTTVECREDNNTDEITIETCTIN